MSSLRRPELAPVAPERTGSVQLRAVSPLRSLILLWPELARSTRTPGKRGAMWSSPKLRCAGEGETETPTRLCPELAQVITGPAAVRTGSPLRARVPSVPKSQKSKSPALPELVSICPPARTVISSHDGTGSRV